MDKVTARELELYIANDGDLYRRQHIPIIKNLMVKHGQGRYNRDLAVKLFMYLVDAGAKKYAKDHGSPGAKWHEMFPKAERTHVAQMLRDSFEDDAKDGSYDEYIPKKYKGKVSGKTIGEGISEGTELSEGMIPVALTSHIKSLQTSAKHLEQYVNKGNAENASLMLLSIASEIGPAIHAFNKSPIGKDPAVDSRFRDTVTRSLQMAQKLVALESVEEPSGPAKEQLEAARRLLDETPAE